MADTSRKKKGHMPIKENIALLFGYQYIEKECMRILGGWLASLPTIELKVQVGDDLFQDAQHGQWLYSRLSELPGGKRQYTVDLSWRKLTQSIVRAPGYVEMLVGVYGVIKKRLVQGYEELFKENDLVSDAPTFIHVQRIIEEKKQQMKKMNQVLAEIRVHNAKKNLQTWIDFLYACFETPEQPWETPEGLGTVKVPADKAVRNPGFKLVRDWDHLTLWCEKQAENKLDQLRYKVFSTYASEMQAAENLAGLLYTWDDMPWEFYYDISRHFWDELRHSQVGLKRMKELGFEGKDFPWMVEMYRIRCLMSPFMGYAYLTLVQEAEAMKIKQDHAKEFRKLGDEISAVLVEYDINDERMHVQLGYKWLEYTMKKTGDPRNLNLVKEEAEGCFEHLLNLQTPLKE